MAQDLIEQEAAAKVDDDLDELHRLVQGVFDSPGASIDTYSTVTHVVGVALRFGIDRAGDMSDSELNNLKALRGVWGLIDE